MNWLKNSWQRLAFGTDDQQEAIAFNEAMSESLLIEARNIVTRAKLKAPGNDKAKRERDEETWR